MFEEYARKEPLWNVKLEVVKKKEMINTDKETKKETEDDRKLNVEIEPNSEFSKNEKKGCLEPENLKTENWLNIARKKLKKIDVERNTPKKIRKKKLENLTPNSGSKKKISVGDRKINSVNEIKKLWEKVDQKKKETDVTTGKKNIVECKKINNQKVKQMVDQINLNKSSIKFSSPKQSNSKSLKLLSQSNLDTWVSKGE